MNPSIRHYAIRIDEDAANRRGLPSDLRPRKYPTRSLRQRVRATFRIAGDAAPADAHT
jgi:hypothetical protein